MDQKNNCRSILSGANGFYFPKIIMIHQFKMNGLNVVIDAASGSIHCVDDLAYDIIELSASQNKEAIINEMLRRYCGVSGIDEEAIREVLTDIESLMEAGKLFAPDLYENLAEDHFASQTVVKALCLHTSHSCNLNCGYCFAGQGGYHGERELMPLEVSRKAIDFLIENSGSRINLEVDFFGGEPLMNWEVVKKTVEYARSIEKEFNKNFRFTLTTNGVLLDKDVIEFSNREMDNVVLSLDGRKEIHDRLRQTMNGKGSYDMVVPKFKELVEARNGIGYYIRGTYTHYNPDFLKDILHMADLGFAELSMEPVVCKPDEPYALTEDDLEELFAQYEMLAVEMIKRKKQGEGFNFYHFMIDLTGGPCIYKRISGCGSGTEYLAVTPGGDLYPCHQFVGEPEYRMGSLWEGITNENLQDEFRRSNVYSKPECRDCWARIYCSGGCAANAYHATGTINGVYEYSCKLFKKRLECAIMIKVAESFCDEN